MTFQWQRSLEISLSDHWSYTLAGRCDLCSRAGALPSLELGQATKPPPDVVDDSTFGNRRCGQSDSRRDPRCPVGDNESIWLINSHCCHRRTDIIAFQSANSNMDHN